MSGVYGYSQTAASNTETDGVSTAEGMNPALVNNAMRGMMAETAEWRDDISGAITSGGSANAQTLTTSSTITAYADGQMFAFVAGFTNTSAATLNVDGVGAKALRRDDDQALTGNEVLAGGHYTVRYDASANSAAGAFILVDRGISGTQESFSQVTITGQLLPDAGSAATPSVAFSNDTDTGLYRSSADGIGFALGGAYAARLNTDGLFIASSSTIVPGFGNTATGVGLRDDGYIFVSATSAASSFNRNGDGTVISIGESGTSEGSISVSGTTVSYNGGHLSRWFQFDGPEPAVIYKGTVMSNRDAMCVWQKEDGTFEENEQLNKLIVSNVPGDPNVAGLYVQSDDDDDHDDHYVAQVGDFVVRVNAGVDIQRGQLLESAGDGTARPQTGDNAHIVQDKTVAKITSSIPTRTDPDGVLVYPCVVKCS